MMLSAPPPPNSSTHYTNGNHTMNDELETMYDALDEIETKLLAVRDDADTGDTTETKTIIGDAVFLRGIELARIAYGAEAVEEVLGTGIAAGPGSNESRRPQAVCTAIKGEKERGIWLTLTVSETPQGLTQK